MESWCCGLTDWLFRCVQDDVLEVEFDGEKQTITMMQVWHFAISAYVCLFVEN